MVFIVGVTYDLAITLIFYGNKDIYLILSEKKLAREILPQSQSTADLHKINQLSKSRHQAPNGKSKEIIKKCKFCNGSHLREQCPAYKKSCLNCNRKNHFKVCCPRNRKKVHEIEQTEVTARSLPILNFL